MKRGSEVLLGVGSSHGVALAPAVVLSGSQRAVRRQHVAETAIQEERERFDLAVRDVQQDLQATLSSVVPGRPEAAILEAYLLMAGDELFAQEVSLQIENERRCADWAVAEVTAKFVAKLERVDDAYMRERSHDIDFVGQRLLRALWGGSSMSDELNVTEPSIVIAHDLSPADTAAMTRAPIVAFVTEVGSRTSHTSIMARALEIPAVVGVKNALDRIGTGDIVIVDGLRGQVIVDPDPLEIAEAEQRGGRYAAMMNKLGQGRDRPARTQDGTLVCLQANIELALEAELAVEHGAEGIGLYRTEYLYVDRAAPPSEEEQYQSFRKVLGEIGDRPVTLRTFDIGGDKFVSTFPMPEELNPMLGLRAVRLALSERALFFEHLRAMARASGQGDVQVMNPMVASLDELHAVRELLEEARLSVKAEGQVVADVIPLGVMIEVPAAAVMADMYAREADFLSIGTNDLVQYALAIDRTNQALAHLASPFDPGVLRLVHGVIRAGLEHDCPVSLCGEMASDPMGALLLLGFGLRSMSMESVAIPEIKEAISRVNMTELETLAGEALACRTASEVNDLLFEALGDRLRDLLTGEPLSTPGGPPPSSDAPPGLSSD
ncbi:MAG: phosphoenolpyruvate--protein phosphotransferase [Polyangiaceae bacterium]